MDSIYFPYCLAALAIEGPVHEGWAAEVQVGQEGVGWTYSTNFPTTPGAFQTACGGSNCDDAFMVKNCFNRKCDYQHHYRDADHLRRGWTSHGQRNLLLRDRDGRSHC
jgi:hypothetical protein